MTPNFVISAPQLVVRHARHIRGLSAYGPILLRNKSNLAPKRHSLSESSDELGIPTTPTWSVNELLSSYPSPKLSHETFDHLHKLSALKTPNPSGPEHAKLKTELEGLVKLVEAVKLSSSKLRDGGEQVPDGRIWKKGSGLRYAESAAPASEEAKGRNLLKHANRTFNGYYEVDSGRTR
jgi:hypothetical protein